jgi:hypothetical protein
MKVYIVGDHGPEHNSIKSVHKTYEGALKSFTALRKELLKKAKSHLKEGPFEEMYERIIKNLSCEDPKKIDNYPHETPYIIEYALSN